ncbi:hypothetical protein A3H81_04575 [Candidatus Daviesbacteria bacterium RIFCSPLOWO2_02_FULL_38_18]|nr:MAG: hypothetical protein A3H81_04575 [Candidatus Daviesbacteria bacterium RIFCSPLOWO2_02_FULL_38_18]
MNASPEGIRPDLITAYKISLGRFSPPSRVIIPNGSQLENWRIHHRVRIDLPMSFATTEAVKEYASFSATR